MGKDTRGSQYGVLLKREVWGKVKKMFNQFFIIMYKKVFVVGIVMAMVLSIIAWTCSGLLVYRTDIWGISLKQIGAVSLYGMSGCVIVAIIAGLSHYIFWEPLPPTKDEKDEVKNKLHIVR